MPMSDQGGPLTRTTALPGDASAVWILLSSSVVLGISDAFIKLVTAHLPPGQFMVLRGIICVLLYMIVMGRFRRQKARQQILNPRVLLRSFFEATSTTCFILAVQSLPVPTVTSLFMTSPIMTICAAFLLGMSSFRWQIAAGAVLAFVGVLLIAAPRGGLDHPAILFGFAAAVLVSVRDLITRAMPATVASSSVALTTMIGVTLAGATLDPAAVGWQPLDGSVALLIVVAAFFTATGNHLVIEAFRRGDPALMSVLRYSTIPIALMVTWAIWGQVPSASGMLGSILVIGAGMLAQPRRRKD